jgi:hypothetical protein
MTPPKSKITAANFRDTVAAFLKDLIALKAEPA